MTLLCLGIHDQLTSPDVPGSMGLVCQMCVSLLLSVSAALWLQVDNYAEAPMDTARERLIGLTNRVIGGILIHTTRMSYDKCEDSRFAKIETNCAGGISTQAYGVDPVFVMGSTLFDPDLDNERSLVSFYNCSEIPEDQQVYNVPDPYSKSDAVVNKPPYCANLYNMRDVPFGFFPDELNGKTSGFPVWIDINLSEDQAQYWYTYLEEGLMLDTLTREMTVDLVTYNAELRMFSSVFVRFRFTDGGAIAVSYKLHTIRVELYSAYKDYVRLCLELVFAASVLATAAYQVKVREGLRGRQRLARALMAASWSTACVKEREPWPLVPCLAPQSHLSVTAVLSSCLLSGKLTMSHFRASTPAG